eukprot:gnl/MRDRNA2_/MRDRNA2_407987_c0_seq1.p1 gnl/MRDRNA2_/MRDRNA2_407987_c0~~gnl/MRDRNA2_/MRDRNA2_407987_c0_seq1.p1  ORF type:complete len:320 (+),score=37.82 gnl/MRDRNA2_/MRDRNA2_407987_c0_seq1:132-962(+)
MLHGLAMATRKQYGQGQEMYWKNPRWWSGLLLDALGGSLLVPSMPFIAVEVFIPLTTLSQIVTGTVLGLMMFGEKATVQLYVGLVSSLVGVVAVCLTSHTEVSHVRISSFWHLMVKSQVILVFIIWMTVIIFSSALTNKETFYTLISSWADAVQFLTSRSLSSLLLVPKDILLVYMTVFQVLLLKVFCIVMFFHFQQKALDGDLAQIAGMYPVVNNMMAISLGVAFYGDHVGLTCGSMISMSVLTFGLVILSQKSSTPSLNAHRRLLEVWLLAPTV